MVQPGKVLRSPYTTGRKGAGYLKVALGVRDTDGGGVKLLYNKRIPVFKDERTLAIPIADPWGRNSLKLLTYRDNGLYAFDGLSSISIQLKFSTLAHLAILFLKNNGWLAHVQIAIV